MKLLYLTLALCSLITVGQAQTGWDISVGGQQYLMPIKNSEVGHWQPQVSGGVNRFLNDRSTMNITLRVSYNRNKYQGNALSWQTLFQYTPVVANHVELGIGMGIGYQLSFYPSKSFSWNGTDWKKGKATKGVVQVPLQFSVGYRGFESSRGIFTPYLAYNTNFLFRYSPDLTPLPSAAFMVGLKYLPALTIKK